MARITLGLASSHTPQLSTPAELWHEHAERDRTNPVLDFPELVRRAPATMTLELEPATLRAKHDVCQDAVATLARVLERAAPDVLVVFGDDQRELFLDECIPTFAVFQGDELHDVPLPLDHFPPSIRHAYWARHAEGGEAYPGVPGLGRHMVAQLNDDGFDVAQVSAQFPGRTLGHAFTFVRRRLTPQRMIPTVPVFINCYYPPNAPTAARCYAFGRAVRRAIESWPDDLTVAIVASGGLTHFVIDESLDRDVLDGIVEKRRDVLERVPVEKMVLGTSEVRNWIAAAGALEPLDAHLVNYTPAYRSPAGTGCGMGFVYWGPFEGDAS